MALEWQDSTTLRVVDKRGYLIIYEENFLLNLHRNIRGKPFKDKLEKISTIASYCRCVICALIEKLYCLLIVSSIYFSYCELQALRLKKVFDAQLN